MPTKTQINFRKQMKAYKKEASADKEKIFSYIENDMISDYYSIEPKRKYIKPVPVAAIILLIIIIGVRIYNFAGTNIPNTSIGIAKTIRGIALRLLQSEQHRIKNCRSCTDISMI